ncbi:element excision factor XisH family protein [Dolichospermum sp. UHCC 0259]|uniref:element excision factor XisH family protein n=1 Tax=Dolichospermum sp. UHCC 0259 TaxID=2590010 RepID=UPI001447C425|nr:hypothetical protein [Dolichospermum sp. UHCC 0259]
MWRLRILDWRFLINSPLKGSLYLYLAVPITVDNEFFILPFIQSVIKTNQLCLVVYNI